MSVTPIRTRRRNGRPQTPSAEAARLRRLAAAWSDVHDTSELLAQAAQVEAAQQPTRSAA